VALGVQLVARGCGSDVAVPRQSWSRVASKHGTGWDQAQLPIRSTPLALALVSWSGRALQSTVAGWMLFCRLCSMGLTCAAVNGLWLFKNRLPPSLLQLKMNTDESPNTATSLNIRSIPTIMIYKGGQKMDAVVGAVPKANLMATIDKYL
jgi:hypothetical protein